MIPIDFFLVYPIETTIKSNQIENRDSNQVKKGDQKTSDANNRDHGSRSDGWDGNAAMRS